jgi:DNA-binding beta-propeller fold protein YncE
MRLIFVLASFGLVACGPEDSRPDQHVPASGDIVSVLGTGEQASDRNQFDADGRPIGIPPEEARLDSPLDVVFDASGRMFAIDWNGHKLRVLEADGLVYPAVGTGFEGDGCRVDPAADGTCPAIETRVNHPADMLAAPGNVLVIAAWHNSKIKEFDFETNAVRDLCGSGARDYLGDGGSCFGDDGTELVALDLPSSVAMDAAGNLFIADQANQVIRRLDTTGVVTTVCGSCPKGGFGCPEGIGYLGDGGPATEAKLNNSYGQSVLPAGKLAFDAEGNLWIADTFNHALRRVTPGPDGILGDDDPADELIETMAGNGTPGFSGDGGPARDALLDRPTDIAFAPDGALVVADRGNHCIRRIDAEGVISTVAGRCGTPGASGDGRSATDAHLDGPFGVAFAPDGALVVADTSNHRIRKILP